MRKKLPGLVEIPPLNQILGRLSRDVNPEIEAVLRIWNELLTNIKKGSFTLRPTWSVDRSPWNHVPHPTDELNGSLIGYVTAIGKMRLPSIPVIVNASRIPADLPADPTEEGARTRLTARMPHGMPPWWRTCVIAPPDVLTIGVNRRIHPETDEAKADGMRSLIRVLVRELRDGFTASRSSPQFQAWDKIPADLWERTLDSTGRAFAVALAFAALRVPAPTHANICPLLQGIASGVLPIGHYEVPDAPLLCIFLVA